jgi:hypothetical protein
MAVGLALVAAFLFAVGTVLWQRGTLQAEAKASDPRFYVQILARPAWLAGTALTVLGGLCQIAALNQGPIVVVQPILVLSLVFALPFGVWLTDQRVGRWEVLGAYRGPRCLFPAQRPRGGCGGVFSELADQRERAPCWAPTGQGPHLPHVARGDAGREPTGRPASTQAHQGQPEV